MTLSNMSSSITHQSADLGLDFAKIQIKFDISLDFLLFLQKIIKILGMFRNKTYHAADN